MFSYDNIGGKIKCWAKWVFAINAITALFGGLILMLQGGFLVLNGLIVVVLGPIVAWVSSWLLYGYGQLIENSDIIAEEYRRKNEKPATKNNVREEKQKVEQEPQLVEDIGMIIANPDVEDDEFIDIICPNCKAELSYTKEQLQNGEVPCPICYTNIPISF